MPSPTNQKTPGKIKARDEPTTSLLIGSQATCHQANPKMDRQINAELRIFRSFPKEGALTDNLKKYICTYMYGGQNQRTGWMWVGKSLATVDCSITLNYHWLLFLVVVPNSLEDVVRSTEYMDVMICQFIYTTLCLLRSNHVCLGRCTVLSRG